MLILSNIKTTDSEADLTRFSLSDLRDQYNALAPIVDKEPVKRFSDRSAAARRLHNLFIEVEQVKPEALKPADMADEAALAAETAQEIIQEEIVTHVFKNADEKAEVKAKKTDGRKSRQKVFNYPPLGELKKVVDGSLRARARDLLLKGATFAQVEELVRQYDIEKGKSGDHRITERTYGLIRLLHTYVGYALREEGSGEDKKIFVMTQENWEAWKATQG